MVTRENIKILVSLLNGWLKLLLREQQRANFFIWLRDHTQTDIHADTFIESLTEWLSSLSDPKDVYARVLIIHAEILWLSQTRGCI